MHRLLVLPLLGLVAAGCYPLGVGGGEVAGEELTFVEVTYVEQRGTDSTATAFHDFDVWMMPMEDSCSRFGPMLTSLEELRADLDFGLPPDEYCDQWEAIWEEHTGLESFWVGHFRMHALPRGEHETAKTDYQWRDEQAEGHADAPAWDADLALYPAPTFDACAAEFSGDDFYGSTLYAAKAGRIEVTAYEQDESMTFRVFPVFEEQGDDNLRGRASVEQCAAALDWPLEFGTGETAR